MVSKKGEIARAIAAFRAQNKVLKAPAGLPGQGASGWVIYLMNRRSRSRRIFFPPASAWCLLQCRQGIFSVCICLPSSLHIFHI